MIDLKVPPHNAQVEMVVLGSLLIDFQETQDELEKITADDFYLPLHQKVFKAIVAVAESNGKPDIISVGSYLNERGDDCVDLLSDMTYQVASAYDLPYYVSILRERSISRKIIRSCTSLTTEAYEPDADALALAEKMETEAIALTEVKDSQIEMQSGVSIFKEMQNNPDVGRIFTLNSFYDNVYYNKGGSRRGQLEYVLAITGHGKTQYLAYLCAMYAKAGNNVEWFQFEDSKYSTVELFLPYGKEILERIRITDECRSIQQVEKVLRRSKVKHDVVVIDYIQAVSSDGVRDVRERVSDVSGRMRMLAKDYDCYVLGASQVARDKTRQGYKSFPTLQDAKESGQVEQDAFVVTSVFRPVMVDELRLGGGYVKNITGDEDISDSALYVRNLKNRRQKINYTPRLLHHVETGGLRSEDEYVPKVSPKNVWYSQEDDVPF